MSPQAAALHNEAMGHARAIPACFTRQGKRERMRAMFAAIKAALRADGWV